MRPIHLARMDKVRPVLVLTREVVRPHMTAVTVAPITSMVRGLSTEVLVDETNGLNLASVISVDNIVTIAAADLLHQVGYLRPAQEADLTRAIHAAFDLDEPRP